MIVDIKKQFSFLPIYMQGYLAGLIDGEGHIGIVRKKPKGYQRYGYQLTIGLCMTDRSLVETFHMLTGGSYVSSSRNRGKDAFYSRLCSNQAVDFIECIEPMLLVKHRQALLAIEFQNFRKGMTRTVPTDEEYDKLTSMYDEMKILNARWSENND